MKFSNQHLNCDRKRFSDLHIHIELEWVYCAMKHCGRIVQFMLIEFPFLKYCFFQRLITQMLQSWKVTRMVYWSIYCWRNKHQNSTRKNGENGVQWWKTIGVIAWIGRLFHAWSTNVFFIFMWEYVLHACISLNVGICFWRVWINNKEVHKKQWLFYLQSIQCNMERLRLPHFSQIHF